MDGFSGINIVDLQRFPISSARMVAMAGFQKHSVDATSINSLSLFKSEITRTSKGEEF